MSVQMAFVRMRPTKAGVPTFSVTWRDVDTGRQTSMPFQDQQSAENFSRILTANGNSLAITTELMAAAQRKAPTIRTVVAEHIDGLTAANARTKHDYRRDAERHIYPFLGHIAADRLTAARVKQWINLLADQRDGDDKPALADKTIANLHGLLSAAMATAVEAGHAPTNPCRGVALPRRADAAEHVALTVDQWKAIDAELGKHVNGHYRAIYRFLFGTGCRWGEAAALQVRDLRLNATPPTANIGKASKRDAASKQYVGTTKTRRSRRDVVLDDTLAADLTERIKGRKPTDLVFPSPQGRMMQSSNAHARAWTPAVKAAIESGVLDQWVRPHDLRHSYASLAIENGVDLYTVQAQLGHESITTTIGTYSHITPTQRKALSGAMSALLA